MAAEETAEENLVHNVDDRHFHFKHIFMCQYNDVEEIKSMNKLSRTYLHALST